MKLSVHNSSCPVMRESLELEGNLTDPFLNDVSYKCLNYYRENDKL